MGANRSDIQGIPLPMDDMGVFEKVFRDNHASLCFYAQKISHSRADAEDTVEEVFAQCWVNAQRFENPEHARYFLFRAVRHAALNKIKKAERAEDKHTQALKLHDFTQESHLERIISSELIGGIYREIDLLPPQQRRVILLSLLEDKKLREVADEMNLSLQTVKNFKAKAIARLRSRLSKAVFLLPIVVLKVFFNNF